MKHPSRSYLPLVVLFLFFSISAFSQNAANQSLYEQFDTSIGKQNLSIYNGTIHINNLRSINNTHRYYNSDKYVNGFVSYEGQPYADVALKYDLLNDIVVVKVQGDNNKLGINGITDKTESFAIYGKKFVNLNYNIITPKFVSGYYEEEILNDKINFYTKYHKDNIEILQSNGVFYKFEESQTFVFGYQNNYYQLGSKSDAIAIFPKLKKDIDAFYEKNTALENASKKLFYKTLLNNISQSLPNQTSYSR
jgi:hypothetical protein